MRGLSHAMGLQGKRRRPIWFFAVLIVAAMLFAGTAQAEDAYPCADAGNTIEIRDSKVGWDFSGFRSRRVWADVNGREQRGANPD